MTEGSWIDACEQAELVRSGEVSPIELVDDTIARIEKLNGEINALVVPMFDAARAAAMSADLPAGPFRGVPLVLKDVGAGQAGMPMYMGNKALRDADYRYPHDSSLGRRLRDAGFIVLGKTNMPEFNGQTTTQPLAFGPTRNPWDLTRSVGGSSGGSAAAVAAGMVPMAHGNDGGGSVRIPAAWCGCIGFRPSRGRVSFAEPAPLVPALWGSASRGAVEFAVTRTVRDTAALLDAIHGSEPGDLYLVPPPVRPYREEVGADPGRCRIGILTEMPPVATDARCVAAAEGTGRVLESLGHVVDDTFPAALHEPRDPQLATAMFVLSRRLMLAALEAALGRLATEDDVEPYLWQLASLPVDLSAEELLRAQAEEQLWSARIARWWDEGHDLLVTPTVFEPPAPLRDLIPPPGAEATILQRMGPMTAFAAPFSTTGQPAITLPLQQTADGLPVGVQLVAAMGREDVLIRVASQLEEALPWIDRRPTVSI